MSANDNEYMLNDIQIVYKAVIKNLNISINQYGDIIVTSPKCYSKNKILEIVNQKKSWIDKQRSRLNCNTKYIYNTKALNHDDKIFFLGKPHSVVLVKSQNNLVLDRDSNLVFFLNESVIDNSLFKQELLLSFFKDRADIIFNNFVAKYLKITSQDIERVSIKKMKTRWGSCNYIKKTINLNLDLITRNVEAIEYVILHEVAHLTHPNHSKEFYNYIAQYMPEWKKFESMLK